jgi:hypothetical protein
MRKNISFTVARRIMGLAVALLLHRISPEMALLRPTAMTRGGPLAGGNPDIARISSKDRL